MGDLVSKEDLHAGKNFALLHTGAMFRLIADDKIKLALDTIPETLLMDLSRLELLSIEYKHAVKGAAFLVTAVHNLAPMNQEKTKLLEDLAAHIIVSRDFDAIQADFRASLVGVLPDAADRLCQTLSSCIENEEDSVRMLM